jgi:hypothetical protein
MLREDLLIGSCQDKILLEMKVKLSYRAKNRSFCLQTLCSTIMGGFLNNSLTISNKKNKLNSLQESISCVEIVPVPVHTTPLLHRITIIIIIIIICKQLCYTILMQTQASFNNF